MCSSQLLTPTVISFAFSNSFFSVSAIYEIFDYGCDQWRSYLKIVGPAPGAEGAKIVGDLGHLPRENF